MRYLGEFANGTWAGSRLYALRARFRWYFLTVRTLSQMERV